MSPSEIRAGTLFPVPHRLEDEVRHRRHLADAVNQVAQAAFAPYTAVKKLTANYLLNSGTYAFIADLTHSFTVPVPCRFWYEFTVAFRLTVAGAAGENMEFVPQLDGVNLVAGGYLWGEDPSCDLLYRFTTITGPADITIVQPDILHVFKISARVNSYVGSSWTLWANKKTLSRIRLEPEIQAEK